MTVTVDTAWTVDETPVPGRSVVPGEPGLWVLIFLEMSVFASLFCGVAYLRVVDPAMVDSSQGSLSQGIGVLNTILLLTGSLFVVLGVVDTRAGRWLEARRWFILGIVCAVGFGIDKAIEYLGKFAHGITPTTNDFFQSYFVLTGLHMLHVVVGAVLLGFMVRYATPQSGWRKYNFIAGAACFWHMVDVIWIGLYMVFYLL